jgi:LysM repeat protein
MRRMVFIFITMLILTACAGGDDDATQVGQNPTAQPVRNFPTTVPTVATTATPTSIFATINEQNPQTGCPIPSGWQAYFVTFGDTLSGLAASIGSTVQTIQQGNCLQTASINTQQLLFLPSLPAGVPTVNPASLNNIAQPPTADTGVGGVIATATSTVANCPIPPGWLAYTVQFGDTLATIANRTNTTVANLQNGNCLGSSELIFANTTLYVPRAPIAATSVTAIPVGTTPTPNIGCQVPFGWQPYTVQFGDTLGVIATTYNTTVANLQNGNCLDGELIFAGTTLYVPPVGGISVTSTPAPTLTPDFVLLPTTTPTTTNALINLPAPLPAPAVRPTQVRDDGALVTLQPQIELDVGVVEDADTVRYRLSDSPLGIDAVLIATDTTPFDGTRQTYLINEFETEFYIFAEAQNAAGTTTSPVVHVVYDPTFRLDPGQPQLNPFVGFDGTIYQVDVGMSVTVSWPEAPTTATRIEFFIRQANAERTIGVDNNPGNGATIVWQVAQTAAGELIARATFADNSTVLSDSVLIAVEASE